MIQITDDHRQAYYDLWKSGAGSDSIRISLGLDIRSFRQHQADFLYYCRNRSTKEFREASVSNQPFTLPLTQERRQEFIDHTSGGLSIPETAEIMGVPLPTVLDVWFKSDPLMKFEVEQNRLLLNSQVIRALFTRAVGTRHITSSRTRTKGKGEKGMVDTTSVTQTEKVVEPSDAAIQLWLTNRMPDQWSKDGKTVLGGNKGDILTAIEADMAKNSEAEEAEFDRLQLTYSGEEEPARITPDTAG